MGSDRTRTIDALSRNARAQLAHLWRLRAQNELVTAETFEKVHAACVALQAPSAVLELSASASDDERRHHARCLETAAVYAPGPATQRGSGAAGPGFIRRSEREQSLLTIVAHCCFSETIAVAYLKVCREQCVVDAVSATLREFLADEVKHARIGWAVLSMPGIVAADHDAVARAAPELLTAARLGWLSRWDTLSQGLVEGHDFIDYPTLDAVVVTALKAVVVPGLRQAGVNVQRAESWFREHAARCAD